MNQFQNLINALKLQLTNPVSGRDSLNLKDHQFNLLNKIDSLGKKETLVVNKARQVGFSTAICFYALFYALTRYGSSVVILGTKQACAKSYLETIKDMLPDSKLLDGAGQRGISLTNGSSIQFAWSAGGLIGGNYDVIFLDEFAFHKSPKEILDSLIALDGKKIIGSTPSDKTTEFYKLWEADYTSKHSIPYTVMPERDDQWMRDMRNSIGILNFATEYELDFRENIELSKEKQIHIRVTDEEKETIEQNAKKNGFNQVSEYLRVLALGNEKKKSSLPFLDLEVCRNHLFFIETEKSGSSNVLSALINDVRIDRTEIHLTFIMDENNTWKKFLKTGEDFKIWWLTRKGEKIDYYQVENKVIDIFPLHFSSSEAEVFKTLAVLKRKS